MDTFSKHLTSFLTAHVALNVHTYILFTWKVFVFCVHVNDFCYSLFREYSSITILKHRPFDVRACGKLPRIRIFLAQSELVNERECKHSCFSLSINMILSIYFELIDRHDMPKHHSYHLVDWPNMYAIAFNIWFRLSVEAIGCKCLRFINHHGLLLYKHLTKYRMYLRAYVQCTSYIHNSHDVSFNFILTCD